MSALRSLQSATLLLKQRGVISWHVNRIFILSPAKTTGRRAGWVLEGRGQSPLAERLHRGLSVPIGEIFSFCSGLYFRGKLAYARAFARPPRDLPGVWVITSRSGLVSVDEPVSLDQLRAFSSVAIDLAEPLYTQPLEQTARALELALPEACEVVFLGSISTNRYTTPLRAVLGPRLTYPLDFVGRGDMSRGGLLLRCVADAIELRYAPIPGKVLRGMRPPKLAPRILLQ